MARTVDPERDEFAREILNQASRIFAECGYRNTTTEDIGEKVGLKKSSLYHYFDNKEEILYQSLSSSLKTSLQQLEFLLEEDTPPARRLRDAIVIQVERMIQAPYVSNLFLTERGSLVPKHLKHCLALRRAHEAVFKTIIDAGVADGSFDPVDSSLAVKVIYGALNGLPWWWQEKGRYSLQEVALRFADMLVDRMMVRRITPSAKRPHKY